MPVSRFQSESYPNDQRDLAWREFLDAIGLLEVWSPEILPASLGNYCSGLAHGKMPDLMLARLSATGRELSPIARRGVAPLIVLPLDEAIEIVRGDEGIVVRGRELGLVPTDPGWHIRFGRNSRTVCLTLPEALLLGRRSTNTGLVAPRVFPNKSIVSIFAAAIEATAAEMERLHGADWAAVAQQLTDLFFCLPQKVGSDVAQRLAFSGLLGRVAQTIESHLGDNDLNAKTVAQMEGISERFMQRLFKRNGETFSQYLRERRLQRARCFPAPVRPISRSPMSPMIAVSAMRPISTACSSNASAGLRVPFARA